jgi:hypothetical protein
MAWFDEECLGILDQRKQVKNAVDTGSKLKQCR